MSEDPAIASIMQSPLFGFEEDPSSTLSEVGGYPADDLLNFLLWWWGDDGGDARPAKGVSCGHTPVAARDEIPICAKPVEPYPLL